MSEALYIGNFFSHIVLYVLARGIFNPVFAFYPCLISVNTPLIAKLMSVGLTVQSYYFIWNMIGIIKTRIHQHQEMKEKKISYFWFLEHFHM